jgi:hypothetical protein
MTDDIYLDEIVRLRERLRRIEVAAGVNRAERVWKASEIADRQVWKANKDAIMLAQREGRVVDDSLDEPEPPARVEFLETGIPRLVQRAAGNIYESTPPEKPPKEQK